MNRMEVAQQEAAQLPRMPQRKLKDIPGDYGWPLLGHTVPFLKDYHKMVTQQAAKHGLIFKSSVLFQHGVTLLGPDANEFVLKDPEHAFSSRAAWNPILEKLFTDGLMLRDFADHKFHRRIMQQAFKKPALASYLGRMNGHIGSEISHWPTGKELRFQDHIKSLLLDVGAQIFFGLEMGPESNKVNQSFIDATDASLAVVRLPIPGLLWHRGMKGRRYLEKFVTGLIPQKRASNTPDFFSELCKAADEEGGLSDKDVMNHMIFLLFAAHDTTTSTLCSIVYMLAKHPNWQDILVKEIEGLNKETLDYDDLAKMEKTDWVFRETLRMRPALTTFPRRTVKEIEYQGYTLPKNTLVSISTLYTHYMEDYWSNPTTFDPERFSDERAEHKKHFYQWVPFGGGHHKCLGLNFAELQTKTFLFQFLKRYRVSVKPGYELPTQQVPLIMPKDGLPVVLEKRA
ncbi:MAG: cytochrome [Alcanivorax borkumensis]|jgi:cytochrome P450|uniref:Cytochrome P450, putative n=1 Tax=Alcanivorax borkumensis (strain ATCC 700651 / DSM 11573 / NCIMB 13689 / SK2) TaxID=393595 RepID=Q0VLW6_ALCBS|nr:cytochrome P450 [Alcanivorax borkumensis]OJH07796.1 MAG: cytochrome [Alcanivorax borkumensis]CAL17832.1 cytochrome P450, putative [Alcanivorax borkumensis SK2]